MNYTVTEVETLLKNKGYNISKRTINSYAFEKKILEVSGGKKAFSDEDVKKLEYILDLKEYTNYTLKQIQKILKIYKNEEIEEIIKKNANNVSQKYVSNNLVSSSNNITQINNTIGSSLNTNTQLNNNPILTDNINFNDYNMNKLNDTILPNYFNHDTNKTNKPINLDDNIFKEQIDENVINNVCVHTDQKSVNKMIETFTNIYNNYKPDFEGFQKGEILIYYKDPNKPISKENIIQLRLYIDRLVKKFKLEDIKRKSDIKDKEILDKMSNQNMKVVSISLIKHQEFELENGDTIVFNDFEKYEKNNVYEKIIEFINLFNY